MPEEKGQAGRDDAADEALNDKVRPGDADEIASEPSQGSAEEEDGGDGQDENDDSQGQGPLSWGKFPEGVTEGPSLRFFVLFFSSSILRGAQFVVQCLCVCRLCGYTY